MRSWIPWMLCGLIAMTSGSTAVAQESWDEGDERRHEEERRDRERHEREEMERRRREGMEPGQKQPPRPGGPMRPPMMRPLSEDEQQQVRAWLKEFEPDRLAKLDHVQRENPEMFMMLLTDTFFEMKKIQEMKERDPDSYERITKERKLDVQCRQLAEKYRKLEEETQKAQVRNELQVLLNQLFDLRESMRGQEVKDLENRLNELRQTLEKRRSNKVLIVENRLKQMLGEKEHMDW